MLSLGPIIFGLILGLVIGSQIKLNVSDGIVDQCIFKVQ